MYTLLTKGQFLHKYKIAYNSLVQQNIICIGEKFYEMDIERQIKISICINFNRAQGIMLLLQCRF